MAFVWLSVLLKGLYSLHFRGSFPVPGDKALVLTAWV